VSLDYRAFLPTGAGDPVVLPYFGGTRVDAPARRLQVAPVPDIELVPGWWAFRIEGRRARPIEPAAPVDLGDRPAVRGHWAGGWLFASGRECDRIALAPVEEPAPLARCTARRWHSGELLLETLDFEDDAEVEARRALEEERPIAGLRGVAPSLRAAFGFALAAAVGGRMDIPVSPREAAGRVHAIADGGRDAAVAMLEGLAAERRRHTAIANAERQRRAVVAVAATARPRGRVRAGDPAERADAALEAAGARMLSCRRSGPGLLEVRFVCAGERFVAVVDPGSLQVFDAGICLAGADREVTLDSLPSVIREAIDTDRLSITRR